MCGNPIAHLLKIRKRELAKKQKRPSYKPIYPDCGSILAGQDYAEPAESDGATGCKVWIGVEIAIGVLFLMATVFNSTILGAVVIVIVWILFKTVPTTIRYRHYLRK